MHHLSTANGDKSQNSLNTRTTRSHRRRARIFFGVDSSFRCFVVYLLGKRETSIGTSSSADVLLNLCQFCHGHAIPAVGCVDELKCTVSCSLQRAGQPVTQPASQPASHPANQATSQPTNQATSQPISWPSANQPASWLAKQLASHHGKKNTHVKTNSTCEVSLFSKANMDKKYTKFSWRYARTMRLRTGLTAMHLKGRRQFLEPALLTPLWTLSSGKMTVNLIRHLAQNGVRWWRVLLLTYIYGGSFCKGSNWVNMVVKDYDTNLERQSESLWQVIGFGKYNQSTDPPNHHLIIQPINQPTN